MAEENKIILDADVKPLKKQLREATLELQNARQKFGELSTEAVNAAKKVAGIRDSIEDANEQAQQFDPGKRFQALTTAASTAAGGIAAAQGALALFGSESKDVEKALLKVQGAMALSQGLSQLKDIGKVGDQLTTAFKGLTAGANGFKKALISTGIGALVVAVGLLVAYWDDILALVGGVSKEQKKLNEATQLDLQAQTEKLDAIDGQANQLKLQGKTEEEILDLKIAQTAEAIMAAEVNLENAKATKQAQIDASKRNQEILAGLLAFLSLPITAILGTVDLISSGLKQLGLIEESTTLLDDSTKYLASFVFDPEKVAEEGDQVIKEAEGALNKLKEQSAGYTLSQQDAQKAAGEKSKAAQEKIDADKLEADKKLKEDKKILDEKTAAEDKEFQKRLNEILIETRLQGIKDENEKARAELVAQQEQELADLEGDTKLRAEQKLAIQKQLEIKNKQELDALDQSFAEADAIKKLDELDAQMQESQTDLDMQKTLLDQKKALLDQFYAEGDITREQYFEGQKEIENAEIKLTKEKYDLQIARAKEASMVLGQLSELAGKQTAAGKALGIASALTNTYVGVTEALSAKSVLPSPFDVVAKVANVATILASGLKAVKAITAVQVPGGSGGGGAVSAPNISASAPSVGSQVPTIGSSPVTALGTMMQGQAPIKAYVVESEVTGTQKRVADIERRAGF
jgi:hypothetical protein